MFGWNDKDTKTVYRIRVATSCLLTGFLLGIAAIAWYFSFPKFAIPVIQGSFLSITGWVVFVVYPFALNIIHLPIPYTSLATCPFFTPLIALLIASFVILGVLFTVFGWDLPFVALLKEVEGHERYGDVNKLVKSIVKEGKTKDKMMAILNPILCIIDFSFLTVWILNAVMLYAKPIESILICFLLFFAFLTLLYGFKMRQFIKNLVSN